MIFNKLYLIIVLSLFQLISCQNKNTYMPVYNIEISHPENKFRIEPVQDKILTLENTNASLPYGSVNRQQKVDI
jgi:hypothetical protein